MSNTAGRFSSMMSINEDMPFTVRCSSSASEIGRASSQTTTMGLNILSLNVAGLVPGFSVLHWLDAQGRTGQRNFVRS